MNDPVNQPNHYTASPSGIECIEITKHFNFCLGNAIKYIWRAGLKGDTLEDLRKAAKYIEFEIQRIEGQSTEPKPVAVEELHNPQGLTDEQIETSKGYRLLNKSEVFLQDLPSKFLIEIEAWSCAGWIKNNWGSDCRVTYRTKLTPKQLHEKREME